MPLSVSADCPVGTLDTKIDDRNDQQTPGQKADRKFASDSNRTAGDDPMLRRAEIAEGDYRRRKLSGVLLRRNARARPTTVTPLATNTSTPSQIRILSSSLEVSLKDDEHEHCEARNDNAYEALGVESERAGDVAEKIKQNCSSRVSVRTVSCHEIGHGRDHKTGERTVHHEPVGYPEIFAAPLPG